MPSPRAAEAFDGLRGLTNVARLPWRPWALGGLHAKSNGPPKPAALLVDTDTTRAHAELHSESGRHLRRGASGGREARKFFGVVRKQCTGWLPE